MLKNDTKEQIRARANIAEVIGRYVNLKSHGRVMKGLCPFHNEKTPSFQVNPENGFYYCFGCGVGGDVFKFVQEIEGIGFREALEMLAGETGVQIEYKPKTPSASISTAKHYDDDRYNTDIQSLTPNQPASKTELLAIHDEAAKYYYNNIKGNRQAVDYFKSRGLEAATVRDFRLGYAPAGWSGLCDCLHSKGTPQSHIVECGLAIAKDGGGVYDRFRDRVIFPLCDLGGRIIAFAGRGLSADTQPKYLNSPETALYKKSGVLYGLHAARQGIRDNNHILIVEGYMDYLALWQVGIRNAAAVSGTAFTEEHARLIKRFANKVTLVFDGDRAGLAAAQKAAFILAPFNLQVTILALPKGDDPDTFVKREGADSFRELLACARTAADFLIDKLISENDDSPHSKSRIVDILVPYAQLIADTIVRDDFLVKISQRLHIDRRHIFDRFRESPRAQTVHTSDSGHVPDGDSRHDRRQVGGRRSTDDIDHPDIGRRHSAEHPLGALEESFFRILLTSPELIGTARQYIFPETFTDTMSTDIYCIILNIYAETGNLDGLSGAIEGNLDMERLVSMLAVSPIQTDNIQAELLQKMILLQRKRHKAQMTKLREEFACSPEPERGRILIELKNNAARLKELNS